MHGGAIYIGNYSINDQGEIFIDTMFGIDNISIAISKDMNTFTLTCDNEIFAGDWTRNNSKTDNYNPTYLGDEKDIYANAIYCTEGKVITITSNKIIYDQETIMSTAKGIKLEDYDKTNTTITTQEKGKEIVYNGITYNLITKEQLNSK